MLPTGKRVLAILPKRDYLNPEDVTPLHRNAVPLVTVPALPCTYCVPGGPLHTPVAAFSL